MSQTGTDPILEFFVILFTSGYFWLFNYAAIFYLFTLYDREDLTEMRKRHKKQRAEGKISCGDMLFIEFGAYITYILKPLLWLVTLAVCGRKKDTK